MSSSVFGFSHSALYLLKQEAEPLLRWGPRRRERRRSHSELLGSEAWAVLGQPVTSVPQPWPVAEVGKAAEWI